MQLIPALFQKEICWYSTFSRTMLCLTFALSGQPCPEKSALPRLRQPLFLYLEGFNQTKM